MLAYAGKGRFVLQRTNLNDLIEDTTHLLQVSISKKAVLRFHLDRALRRHRCRCHADPSGAHEPGHQRLRCDRRAQRRHLDQYRRRARDRTYLDKTFQAPNIPIRVTTSSWR